MAEPKLKTLKLKNIQVDREVQQRKNGTDPETVERYAEAIARGDKLPPGRVFKTPGTGTLWLADGFHRLAAALKAGLDELEFEVVTGSRKDARIYAACSNHGHGKASTLEDRRQSMLTLLTECPEWTDSRIAAGAHVDHKTVAAARKRLGIADTGERVGVDGKTYSSNGGHVGNSPTESDEEGENDASDELTASTSDASDDASTEDGTGQNAPSSDADESDEEGADDTTEEPVGPASTIATTDAVIDDPMHRVEKYRADFGNLLKLLKAAGTALTELLSHHQAGFFLRRMQSDDNRKLFVERPRIIRSGRHEGGWHSDDLARLLSAVQQAKVDRPCLACRGAGCTACYDAGFVPADMNAFRAQPIPLDFGEGAA